MRSQTSSKRFVYEALSWLRALPNFSSEVRDEDELDPQHLGVARVRGHLARASRVSVWAYASLWGLFAGAVLSMFGLPALDASTNHILNEVGYVVLALGVASVIEYRIESRRHRSPLLVELRAASAPATEEALERLQHEAAGSTVWLVSETPPTAEVLDRATRLGMHWVTLEHGAKQVPARAA